MGCEPGELGPRLMGQRRSPYGYTVRAVRSPFGRAIFQSGVGVHVGQTYILGFSAYAVSVPAGASVVVLIRLAVRKEFGPIIP